MIPQFKKLITRDKDRYKRRALAEFAYIYFMYDYKSPYMSISETERISQITKHLHLEDWKVDSDITEAVEAYISFQETPSIKALKSTKEALISASKVIDIMNAQINESIELKVDAIEIVDKLLSLTDKLPKAIGAIALLEEKVQKEQHENSKIRGGGKKGTYED